MQPRTSGDALGGCGRIQRCWIEETNDHLLGLMLPSLEWLEAIYQLRGRIIAPTESRWCATLSTSQQPAKSRSGLSYAGYAGAPLLRRRPFLALGCSRGAATCVRDLGDIHQAQRRFGEAVSPLNRARNSFGDPLGVENCHRCLEDVYLAQLKSEDAIVSISAVHSVPQTVLGRLQIRIASGETAMALVLLCSAPRPSTMRRCPYDSWRGHQAISGWQSVANRFQALVWIYQAQGDFSQAIDALISALHICETIDNVIGHTSHLCDLGQVYSSWHRHEEGACGIC